MKKVNWWSIFGFIIIPIAVLGIVLLATRPDFSNPDVAVTVIVVALVVFAVCIAAQVILTMIYERNRLRKEIEEEQAIEEHGEFIYEEEKAGEHAYEDQMLEEVIKKKKLILMTREEIIEYCKTLNYYIPTNVTLRTHTNLPDVAAAGEKNYCLIHEHQGIIKLTAKNNALYFNALSIKHPHISQAAITSDWFEIMIDDSFSDNQQIKDIIKSSYEYVRDLHFRFDDGAYTPIENEDIKTVETLVATRIDFGSNAPFNKILEKRKKLKELTLIHREAIADYAENNIKDKEYVRAYVIRRNGFKLYSLKANNRSYGLLYERETVVKVWIRLDEDLAEEKMKLYPTILKAACPRGRDWYSVILDSHFDEDAKISELLHESYEHVCENYLTKKPVEPK
ncbi:MAG: hypothetical protein FWG51_03590 [Firmicutes bacterium]|nr:hypothetical protein [Bacillota bacterium]